MAYLLPIRFPFIVMRLMDWLSGESGPEVIVSSHGRSKPSADTCARKSATVFSEGIRTNFESSAIKLKLAAWVHRTRPSPLRPLACLIPAQGQRPGFIRAVSRCRPKVCFIGSVGLLRPYQLRKLILVA